MPIGPILARHLAEARAAPAPGLTLTPADSECLARITAAWNADRAARRVWPSLSPEDVLRNALRTMATLVAGEDRP